MSPQETFCTLYPFFVTYAGFCESIRKCKECFGFWGGAFPMAVSDFYRSLLCSSQRRRCLCFSIFVLYFSSVSVCALLYDLYILCKQKENIKIICEILKDKFIRHRKVTYVVNNNRLGCFVFEKQTRKITAEFHKLTPVKLFIDCSITLK